MYQVLVELLNYLSLGGAANSEYLVQDSTDWIGAIYYGALCPGSRASRRARKSELGTKKAMLKLKVDCAGPKVIKAHHAFSASLATGQTSFHKPSLSPPPSSFFPPHMPRHLS